MGRGGRGEGRGGKGRERERGIENKREKRIARRGIRINKQKRDRERARKELKRGWGRGSNMYGCVRVCVKGFETTTAL